MTDSKSSLADASTYEARATAESPSPPPVFVLGILPRSGTNFLSDLLALHPACALPAGLREDWLLHHADGLVDYARAVRSHWRNDWTRHGSLPATLEPALAEGLSGMIADQAPGRRVITKTPSVRNLRLFPDLFPRSKLLVLVRDGRSLAVSAARSFGLGMEPVARDWARAARAITAFAADSAMADRCLVVRYEDLMATRECELDRIFRFLDLDPDAYDFEAAARLPVRGSSDRLNAQGEVDWDPVGASSDFAPIARWRDWPRRRHERFNRLARAELEAFGYEPARFEGGRLIYALLDHLLDVWWWLSTPLRRARVARWNAARERRSVLGSRR